MKILFVAGFGPIATNIKESRRLYRDVLGLPLEEDKNAEDYLHTEKVEGVKGFGVWPLYQAAESCFGRREWPADIVTPQAWLEFDVEDVEEATRELESAGYRLLVRSRKEPWGQVVTRMISPEGFLVGVTETPWMRDKD